MEKLTKQQKDAIEELGWSIIESAEYYELNTDSPAGEDLWVTLEKGMSLKEQAFANYDNFDEDEHIEMWVDAKRQGGYGVPSVRELVVDAGEIKNMFEQLALLFA